MLVTALVDDQELSQTLSRLPMYASQTLTQFISGPLSEPTWVERYRYMHEFATIGRGYNYSTAFEVNLKVKEYAISPETPTVKRISGMARLPSSILGSR